MKKSGFSHVSEIGLCFVCLTVAALFTLALFNDSWKVAVVFSIIGLVPAVRLAVKRHVSLGRRAVAIALLVSLLAVCLANLVYGLMGEL